MLGVDCWLCPPKGPDGEPLDDPRRACHVCRGTGTVAVYRCPWAHCGEDALFACDALLLSEAGILPDPGGLLDQSATLVEGMMLASSERAAYLRREAPPTRKNKRPARHG